MKKLYFLLCLMLILVVGFGQWYPLVSGTTQSLKSVHFTDANTGYSAGSGGTIIITTNGGVTGFNEYKKQLNTNHINVYPNPVTDELIIEITGNKEKTNFEIFNSAVQLVFKGSVVEKTIVKTKDFSPGVYMIKFGNGKSFEFRKVVKE